MFGQGRRAFLVASIAILVVAGAIWLAIGHFVPGPPKRITIAAGSKGGAYEFYAQRYKDVLALTT